VSVAESTTFTRRRARGPRARKHPREGGAPSRPGAARGPRGLLLVKRLGLAAAASACGSQSWCDWHAGAAVGSAHHLKAVGRGTRGGHWQPRPFQGRVTQGSEGRRDVGRCREPTLLWMHSDRRSHQERQVVQAEGGGAVTSTRVALAAPLGRLVTKLDPLAPTMPL